MRCCTAAIAVFVVLASVGCTNLGGTRASDTIVPVPVEATPEAWRFLESPTVPSNQSDIVTPIHEPRPIVRQSMVVEPIPVEKPGTDLIEESQIPELVKFRFPLPLPILVPIVTSSLFESPRIANLDTALIGQEFAFAVDTLQIPIPDVTPFERMDETSVAAVVLTETQSDETALFVETTAESASDSSAAEIRGLGAPSETGVASAVAPDAGPEVNVEGVTDGPIIRQLPATAIRLSRVGITIPVAFDGFGWIYVPDESAAETSTGFAYVGRDLNESGAVFNFRVDDPGNYSLHFQRQDNATGTFESATVELLGSDAILGGFAIANESGGESVVAPLEAEQSYELMLRKLIEGGSYGPAFALAMENGNYTQAIEHYVDGIASARSDIERYATTRGFVDASFGAGTAEPLVAVLPSLVDEPLVLTREDLEELALFLDSSVETQAALTVYDTILKQFDRSMRNDEVHILIARLYERDGPFRNERLAHDHYKELTDSFPLSRYYEEAERRMQHIERHFINIR